MGKIVAVANPKGGSGKTTFAQNFLLPASGRAVFIHTDIYDQDIINYIQNSKHLVKAITLNIIQRGIGSISYDITKISDELVKIISEYNNENIIIDVGSSAMTVAMLPAITSIKEITIFVPTTSQSFLESSLDVIKKYTKDYIIVDIKEHGNGQIYIPEINHKFLGFIRDKGITLPETAELNTSETPDLAYITSYKLFHQEQIDAIINNIKKIFN